jgi:hypothetical protein
MKQTAVEWLEEQIKDIFYIAEASEMTKQFKSVYDRAKEMEKQQIFDAGNSCAIKQVIHNRKVDLMSLEELEDYAQKDVIKFGEEYYNETFGNNRIA